MPLCRKRLDSVRIWRQNSLVSRFQEKAIRADFDIVDAIYDAATDATKWRGALGKICDSFSAFGGHLIHLDMTDGRYLLQLLHGFDHPASVIDAHMAQFTNLRHEDPRIQAALRYPGKPLSCRQVIAEDALHRSRVYRELLQPMDVEYTLFVQLTDHRGTLTGLALFRRPGEEPWSQHDCDTLGVFIPHLRRGIDLLRRYTEFEQQSRLSYALLDAMSVGIVVCRPDGEMQFANRAAQTLADQADGITLHNGRLSLWQPADQALLERCLVATASGGEHSALAIQRPSSARPYHCLISRVTLPLPERSSENDGPVLALYLSDPNTPIETSSELLARLYGLTPMEARVAERIVRGCSVAEVAATLSVERSTVRTHLKAVFAKANVHHQSELVRHVLANPFWATAHENRYE